MAFSDLVVAIRGIVAGSGLATTEMRIVMIDIVDAALLCHPTVTPTLFVDDLSSEHDGTNGTIVSELGGFNDLVALRIQEDGMEVSQSKSVVSASSPALGAEVMDKLKARGIKHTLKVKRLGGSGGRCGEERHGAKCEAQSLQEKATQVQDPTADRG